MWSMNFLKKFEARSLRLAGCVSSSTSFWRSGIPQTATQKSGMFTLAGSLISHFPALIRDALLAEGLAEPHHWVPNSGWITFRVQIEDDLKHALWLMRLSYLRYALKTANDPDRLLERESEALSLTPQLKSLLGAFVPRAADNLREHLTS